MYYNRVKKLFGSSSFPDILQPDEVKDTDEFGVKFAKAIEYQWFHRRNESACEYYDRLEKYKNLRLYSRGEQPTKLYKDLLAGGEDESYTNYDWRPLQIVPKFVKLLSNQMSERLFNIKVEATDKFSTQLKDNHRDYLMKQMFKKPFLQEAEQMFGMKIMTDDERNSPDSDEEIDLYMSLKYKPAIEVATEEAIQTTLSLNNYNEVQSRVIEDIIVLGMGAVRHFTDPVKGITIKHINPENLIYSPTEERDFKDTYYYGEVEPITINELKRITNGKFTDTQLKEISESAVQWDKYHNLNSGNRSKDDIGGNRIYVMNFTFKSTKTIVHKKKYNKNGGFKLIKKDSTFDAKGSDFETIKKTIDVWYKGSLVLGTEYIYNYGLAENMIRPKGYINRTIPEYIVYAPDYYDGRTTSLIQRIVPYVDQMQQIHIKLQQLIAKARPNGIYIDVDGLSEIDMGDGNFLNPLEALKIYNETGNVIGTNRTDEGEYNYGRKPIEELKNGIVDGLDRLIGAYNHYLTLLRDAIGIPAGADASMPHPDTLVGVQKQVVLNSNTATRHILDSMLNISKGVGNAIVLRLNDVFKYSNLRDFYINSIGKNNFNIIKSIKNFHLYDLGLNIELKPDIQEKQAFEMNIQQALQQQLITLDDAIDIRSISNIKLANALIKIRRQRREKEKQAQAEKLEKIRSDGQIKSAQIASQSALQEIKLKTDSELKITQEKTSGKIQEIEAEKKAKSELMKQEFEYNMTLKGIDTQHQTYLEKYKNANKIKGIDKQSSNDSKKIEQKQFGLPAVKFESSEDNISGGIDMGELEPH